MMRTWGWLLLVALAGTASACGDDDDDDAVGDGDADADADGDGDGDADGDADGDGPCASLCGGEEGCVAAQVLDHVTGQPVTPADNLVALINDPITDPPTFLATAPIDQADGCFVAMDIPATTTDVRLVDVTEAEDPPPDPDRVVYTVNWAGPGNVGGTCCDFPMTVVRRADEEAWNADLGLAEGEGLEATGGWIGVILGDAGPLEGATLRNSGADELRAHYFNDDMSGFDDSLVSTGPSGQWVVMMTAPPFELGNFSASHPEVTAFTSATAGTVPGQLATIVIMPE